MSKNIFFKCWCDVATVGCNFFPFSSYKCLCLKLCNSQNHLRIKLFLCSGIFPENALVSCRVILLISITSVVISLSNVQESFCLRPCSYIDKWILNCLDVGPCSYIDSNGFSFVLMWGQAHISVAMDPYLSWCEAWLIYQEQRIHIFVDVRSCLYILKGVDPVFLI